MTLTPDRTPGNPEKRDPRSDSSDAATGAEDASGESSSDDALTLFDQLKDSNLDLTGHPLAKTFEALAPVPTGEPDTANEAVEPTAEGAESADDDETDDVHEAVP
ncbi:MAG: HNH endonuclease, partial [Brevibacterium aurantiacum]